MLCKTAAFYAAVFTKQKKYKQNTFTQTINNNQLTIHFNTIKNSKNPRNLPFFCFFNLEQGIHPYQHPNKSIITYTLHKKSNTKLL